MKKIIYVLIIGIACVAAQVSAAGAMGSAFGCLTTATTLGQGRGNFGGGVGIADATSAFGSFTYGLSKYTDGRLRLGLYDRDNGTKLALGGDFKWQFWNVAPGRREPLDMSLGGFFEYTDAGLGSVFEFGGQVIGSYPIAVGSGGTLSPYGRFNVRLESWSPDIGSSKTNLELGVNGGVAWSVSKAITFFGEFQIDGNDGVFLGIDFNVM
jgi:hypothetical protein